MKHIAVIPARSGSKGLADKNIKALDGQPLIAYSLKAAFESNLFDCVHVSTDSKQYAEIALAYGADVPFLRKEALSTDQASTWDVIQDVLDEYSKLHKEFDMITILQPTSPLRTAEDIRKAYQLFVERDADTVISVCEMEHSPLWSHTLPEDLCMDEFLNQRTNQARQQLPVYYRLNGAIYMLKTEVLSRLERLYGNKSYAYIMDTAHSIDIDTQLDFDMAEFIMRKTREEEE